MPTAPYRLVTFQKDDIRLTWFTVISTLGTSRDVTFQELRLETFFPADEATAALGQQLASSE
ncbi:MAG TPA: hypothetical protein EYQ81_09065 [Sneathiellales bacterium]|nr:hypothetical protein [Sneathiellales bacterium]